MKKHVAVLLATWFYSGLIPPILVKGMAGTYGSIFSLPLCYVLIRLCWAHPIYGWVLYAVTIIALTAVGLWCIPIAEEALGPRRDWHGHIKTRDQNQIVIDETVGMLFGCLVPAFVGPRFSLGYWLLLVLVAFRLLDTLKPWPADKLDKRKDAWGVLLDDVAAGAWIPVVVLLAACVVQAFIFYN